MIQRCDAGAFLDRFNILKELGEGSYGSVVLAFDIQCARDVALKIIPKSSIEKISHINRLRREINLLRILKHPNIVELYDVIVRGYDSDYQGNCRSNDINHGIY